MPHQLVHVSAGAELGDDAQVGVLDVRVDMVHQVLVAQHRQDLRLVFGALPEVLGDFPQVNRLQGQLPKPSQVK